MKILLINIFFFATLTSYTQKKEVKNFMFNDTKIEYTRVDYSKYGIGQFFITMYARSPENNLIEKQSINCLTNKNRLYHTLYFFLSIPTDIKNENIKNELFSKFVTHLKKEENLDTFNLYLNFDYDYSISYQKSEKNVKRVTTKIRSKEICKTLTVR
ncbi:hypothetical protein [Joostella sp.]|uniref:hypothetical protein n=1 Tax=Joostella sp. TaxID=2231138 RepID=UPI003A906DFC